MWTRRGKKIEDSDRVIKDAARSRERTMHRAVRLLAAKPRSIGELRKRLLEKLWTNDEIVDAVIEKLKEYEYLDDQKYAVSLALSKLRQKPQGKRRLQQTLSQKELDRETISDALETAFEKMPEEDLIDTAIEKRIRIKGVPETREDKKKFYDHLLRQGFDFDLIRKKLSALSNSEKKYD
jgi:regulatory protein